MSTVLDFYFKGSDNSGYLLVCTAEFGCAGVEDVGLLFFTSYVNNHVFTLEGAIMQISRVIAYSTPIVILPKRYKVQLKKKRV